MEQKTLESVPEARQLLMDPFNEEDASEESIKSTR